VNYETRYGGQKVYDALGLSLYYSEAQFASAMMIIHPDYPQSFHAESNINRLS
jgi:hypothetical protein